MSAHIRAECASRREMAVASRLEGQDMRSRRSQAIRAILPWAEPAHASHASDLAHVRQLRAEAELARERAVLVRKQAEAAIASLLERRSLLDETLSRHPPDRCNAGQDNP
jgi:hypothetical protein